MKSWSVVFCVAAVAATASACGSGTQDSGGASGATTAGNVTLTLTAITDDKPAWEELFAEYKKVEPNVTFKPSYRRRTSCRRRCARSSAAGTRRTCS